MRIRAKLAAAAVLAVAVLTLMPGVASAHEEKHVGPVPPGGGLRHRTRRLCRLPQQRPAALEQERQARRRPRRHAEGGGRVRRPVERSHAAGSRSSRSARSGSPGTTGRSSCPPSPATTRSTSPERSTARRSTSRSPRARRRSRRCSMCRVRRSRRSRHRRTRTWRRASRPSPIERRRPSPPRRPRPRARSRERGRRRQREDGRHHRGQRGSDRVDRRCRRPLRVEEEGVTRCWRTEGPRTNRSR